MTKSTFGFAVAVLFAAFVCGCALDDNDIGQEVMDEKYSLTDMRGTNLVLPFPDNERHTVTQIENGETSHSVSGYELSIDFSGREGAPVVAPMGGYVSLLPLRAVTCPAASGMPSSGANAGFGQHLYIESSNSRERVHIGHLSSIIVSDGRWVNQGQVVGYEGSTGCATGPHIHLDCSISDDSGNWEAARCSPLSGHVSFTVGQVLGGNEFVNLPVGTTVQAYGRPEIYLVCAPNTLCHIADWDAYRTRRYFYDSMRPTAQVVMVDPSAIDCYERGDPIAGLSERYIIECGDGHYLVIREGGRSVRRWIRYDPDAWPPEREALLMSWGMDYVYDHRGLRLSECWSVPEGEPLTLRDGTVVEFPDDNDFYVVTGETCENEADANPRYDHGWAVRLMREKDGQPFFPVLYGSFNRVLQISRTEMTYLVNGIRHGEEFDPNDAHECRYGDGVGGSGEPYCGDGQCGADESCDSCPSDCGGCAETVVCGDGNCSVGESCHNCVADCGACSTSVCGDGICQLDEGLYGCPTDCAEGPFCGDGVCATNEDGVENCRNCELDCGFCPPETDLDDPPFTVRCEWVGDSVRVQFTGPVLERLIDGDELVGIPTGIYIGSNGLGRWSVPYGRSDPRPYLAWPGGDGSGTLILPATASGLNFALADSAGHVAWFDIERAMSAETWNVVGDCRVDGTLIYFDRDASPPDDSPYCGDGTCDSSETCSGCAADCGTCPEPEEEPADEHTIVCSATSDGLEMTVYGPVTDLLIGSLTAEPVGIYAGCNNCGGWTVPYSDGGLRPFAEWEGDAETYSLRFPAYASGINLAVVDSAGHVAWFDIETAFDARRWAVTGDCHVEGTLIVQN